MTDMLHVGDKIQIHGQVLRVPTKDNTAVRVMLVPSQSKLLFLKQDITCPSATGLWENAVITKALLNPQSGVLPQRLPGWAPWKSKGQSIFLDVPETKGGAILVGKMESKELAEAVAVEHNAILLRVQQPDFLKGAFGAIESNEEN
jgi:hypothetical protein